MSIPGDPLDLSNDTRKWVHKRATEAYKKRERGAPEFIERNKEIKFLHDAKISYKKLSLRYGLTVTRIHQIISMEKLNEKNGYRSPKVGDENGKTI